MRASRLAVSTLTRLILTGGLLMANSAAFAQTGQISGNEFNPAVSLIFNGALVEYEQNPEEYELSGIPLGGEAGLADEGFTLLETELAASANIDDLFYGKFTLAFHQEEGAIETDLEEAFFRTLTLPHGFSVQAGRFFSSIGYQNNQHSHSWDFVDAPLLYRGLFGKQIIDTGAQVSWLAPTDLFLEVGAEWLRGDAYPAGSGNQGKNSLVAFAHTGGDFNQSSSWQLGISGLQANSVAAELGGHAHGHGGEEEEGEAADVEFDGDVRLYGIDVVYKWAPNGNAKQRNFKLQAEYFRLERDGDISIAEEAVETTTLDGSAQGFYIQGIYQFKPRWRVGLRYDRLDSDTHGSDAEVLEEAGFEQTNFAPERYSLMLDYSHSEFSRLRLQVNQDDSSEEYGDTQMFVQYIMSLGAHGAHRY